MNESISEGIISDYNINNNSFDYSFYSFSSSKEDKSNKLIDNLRKKTLNTSNIREIIFSDKRNFHIDLFKSEKFAVCYNETIKTYLFNLYIFSEFTNPKLIENDQRVNIYLLERNKEKDIFQYEIKELLENLNLASNKSDIIQNFLKDINSFFEEESYILLKQWKIKYKKTIIFLLILLIIIFLLSIKIFLIFRNRYIQFEYYIIGIYIVLIIIMLFYMKYIIQKIVNIDIYLLFNQIKYMINKENEIKQIINKWNQKEFESIRIKVSVPISLNYILFNLDPFQNILIENLDISNVKNIFYPQLKNSKSEFIEFGNINKLLF